MIKFVKKILSFVGIKKNTIGYNILSFIFNFRSRYPYLKGEILIKYKYLKFHKIVAENNIVLKSLPPKKKEELQLEINKQIDRYLKTQQRHLFVFIEIGSLLGDGLTTVANIIHDRLKENYLVISIDPYQEFSTDYKNNINQITNKEYEKLTDSKIKKYYHYFINNISLTDFKENFIHIRKKSDDAFKLIRKMNIKIDFCYIDGCHYYDYFKNDYENCKSLIKKNEHYCGQMTGDDYEISFTNLLHETGYTKEKLEKIVNQHKNITDYLYLESKSGDKIGFHPGILYYFKDFTNINITDGGIWFQDNLN